MNGQFGYSSQPNDCDHQGMWEAATIAGYGIMMCTGCGLSFSLMDHENQLYWREVEIVTATDLAEAMQPVRDEEDSADRVQQEPGNAGRTGSPLPCVQEDMERQPGGIQEVAA